MPLRALGQLCVDSQEAPSSRFASAEFCCPLVQACFAVSLAQCIKLRMYLLLTCEV